MKDLKELRTELDKVRAALTALEALPGEGFSAQLAILAERRSALQGDGVIAQGEGAVAAGKGGIVVGGSVQGDIVTGRKE